MSQKKLISDEELLKDESDEDCEDEINTLSDDWDK